MNITTQTDQNIQLQLKGCEQTLAQMKAELKVLREKYQMWKSELGQADTRLSSLQNKFTLSEEKFAPSEGRASRILAMPACSELC